MVGGHVYVTVYGFGKRVVPALSPFELGLDADGSLVVTVDGRRATVRSADRAEDSLAVNATIADVIVGPDASAWWIDAGKFQLPFPEGWTLLADGGVEPPFFLLGSEDSAVFVRVAEHVPTGEALVAIGQTVLDRTAIGPYESVELAYEHEGRAWLQRHAVLTVRGRPYAVLTAQAPLEVFEAARDLQRRIARSIVFAS